MTCCRGKKIIFLIFGLILMLSSNVVACNIYCSDCTSCITAINSVSSGQTICLNTSIFSNETCINNPANFNNKIFDCRVKAISGNGSDYGIYLKGKYNNTIKNCIISNFNEGIYLSSSVEFIGGSYVEVPSSNNLITSNFLMFNNGDGIFIKDSSNNIISDNYIYQSSCNVGCGGISLWWSTDNYIINNNITSNTNGIYLKESSNNFIYNNFFDNWHNIAFEGNASHINYWNTTKKQGKNIIDGSYLGGNFWSGFSNNLTSCNPNNGFCQNIFSISTNNIDKLPLTMLCLSNNSCLSTEACNMTTHTCQNLNCPENETLFNHTCVKCNLFDFDNNTEVDIFDVVIALEYISKGEIQIANLCTTPEGKIDLMDVLRLIEKIGLCSI
ncbi:MAG: hypothetical protein CVT89_04710 [Candidatus Altiarchaeales archaeon HGW-Altiarchaeales-2]|nr:MAG: hypothetical protein CVT89_04710 [Candidatus Altiarchaeales archaeon HGW-Altiarchaeales-2]